jgi:hypothetical protein
MHSTTRVSRRRGHPWPQETFAHAVAQNNSISGVLAQLGSTVSGTNYGWVHKLVAEHGLDTSHWLGHGHLRGKHHAWSVCIPLEEILVERSTYTDRFRLKKRLLAAGLLRDECAICGIVEWQHRKLVLQLDHVNGIGDDHRLENLRLVCPNCHSQTTTYCGRNIRLGRQPFDRSTKTSAEGGTRTPTGFPKRF